MRKDHSAYLREWAANIRKHNGSSVDADQLDSTAAHIAELEAALRPFGAAYRYVKQMGDALRKTFLDAMCTGGKCTPQDWHRAAELAPERKE